jgi:prepilin-type N-terminal cleavage/methylation domain-containing protein
MTPSLARQPARGFTLVELLVAIVVINVGLLALVAASAVVVREADEGKARAAAVRAASNRLEWLASRPCSAPMPDHGSVSAAGGLREEWSVERLTNGVRELRDSVTYTRRGSTLMLVLRSRVTC